MYLFFPTPMSQSLYIPRPDSIPEPSFSPSFPMSLTRSVFQFPHSNMPNARPASNRRGPRQPVPCCPSLCAQHMPCPLTATHHQPPHCHPPPALPLSLPPTAHPPSRRHP